MKLQQNNFVVGEGHHNVRSCIRGVAASGRLRTTGLAESGLCRAELWCSSEVEVKGAMRVQLSKNCRQGRTAACLTAVSEGLSMRNPFCGGSTGVIFLVTCRFLWQAKEILSLSCW